MSITPEAFIKKYSDTKLNERGGAQLHFIDLCELLDIPRPDGSETYRFEQPVLKVAGGKGFADVFYEGKFGWEYKGKGADLKKAYQQLLSYREDLENPPLLIVSDMQNIELHTNFTGTQKQVIRWELNDLKDSERRKQLRQVWTEPQAFNPSHRIEEATVAAVAALGKISNALKDRQENPEMVAHFLVRTMFTLFAEDVELIPADTFKRLLEAAKKHPEDFQEMCQELFAAMKVGKKTVIGRIPYINGGVFEDTSAPALNAEEVNELYYAARRNWKQVDPTIFGTLFETVIDPGKRWQLGAHYTPLVDILDVVEPVIMRPLREEWEALRQSLKPILAEIEQARAQHSGGLYVEGGLGQTQQDEAVSLLTAFQDRLARVKVLDPAMGSGNFLYVTMRLLLDLEAEVRETIRTITQNVPPAPKVGPRQMLGMEVNPYAHEIAGMVLWIGYLQWMREHHEPFKVSPVLDKLPGLLHQDAVYDEQNQTVRDWPAAEFIVGNPPFVGNTKMRQSLGNEYAEGIRKAYTGRVPGFADFVTYWFEKARQNIEEGKTKRAGLISTNSVRGGANAEVLSRILNTGGIFLAWPDRAWIQDGAAVRVSIIGFDNGSQQKRAILQHQGDETDPKKRTTREQAVSVIRADLTSGADLRQAQRLKENAGKSFEGVKPAGKFDLPGEVAREWLDMPNPSGVSNRDVLKPYISGDDIVGKSLDRYTIDFNQMPLEEAEKYRRPMQYVVENVKPEREKNNEKSTRENWWRYKRTVPALRAAFQSLDRFVGTSRVGKHRVFVWLPTSVIPSDLVTVIALDDDYSFGILNSGPHTTWALKQGTSLGPTPRYTPSTCFETFPFPRPTPEQKEAIEQAARYLENSRNFLHEKDTPGRPTGHKLGLTDMYNLLVEYRASKQEKVSGLAGLADAHDMLDKAVAAAYGWAWPMDEDELLGKLLELNLKRASEEK
ncbi:class I SAM-dependent DNA methyltransferase [Deinococcus fonticola]|uniref:class I SAM-dependent DNA methyltransferase n=1 Tax=Deinococcus fonticola TaxID=2528713 RepID=UPI0010753E8F|nr:DNA methyltransferase [Deinococcus fonticola]